MRHWICTKDAFGLHLTNNERRTRHRQRAAVDWLRGCGLVLGDGVSCEASLFTVGAEDVVVTGDIARWPKLRFDDLPRRVEHWLNAVEQGRAAAETLLLGPALRGAALARP